jgi:phosphatidylserine decarboxylase
MLWFFRGWKNENTEYHNNILYSPCEGRIENIIETDEFIHIMIFLNIHNIHVQYAPLNCIVKKMKYIKGTFYPAYMFEKSKYNERQEYILQHPLFGDVVFKQIAGQVARRIQPFVKEGDHLKVFEPIGLIKFGSRCDLILSRKGQNNNIKVLCHKNEKIKIGQALFNYTLI